MFEKTIRRKDETGNHYQFSEIADNIMIIDGKVMAKMAESVAPLACKAFKSYMLHSFSRSRKEAKAVKAMLEGGENPLTGRSRRELNEKLGLEEEQS